MTIVAISREMGSEGYAIGAAVAKALGFEYVDRQIILQAAQAHGIPEATLTDAADRHPSLWERFDEERHQYLTFLEAAYYSFAEQGNVVTASRGGPFFVRGVAHALTVRITAPLAIRVRRIMARDRLDEKAATAKVRAYDRVTAARVDYLFNLDWTQPLHYHVVLNTDTEDLTFYTDLLAHAARHPRYQPTPASLQRLHDLSLAAHVRAVLVTDPATNHLALEVIAQAGQVTLKGVLFRPGLMDAAAKIVARVPGVKGVACEVVPVPIYQGPIM
jgi:cytidylate kinase